jgi:hypothetical protein
LIETDFSFANLTEVEGLEYRILEKLKITGATFDFGVGDSPEERLLLRQRLPQRQRSIQIAAGAR